MNWQSTKYIQAMLVQVVSAIALFTGHIDGGTWVGASALALGIYSIADVAQKRVVGDRAE